MAELCNCGILAEAIVEQAVKDYVLALKKIEKNRKVREQKAIIRELKKFFRSAWYDTLCTVDGEKMIELIEKNYKQIHFKYKKCLTL